MKRSVSESELSKASQCTVPSEQQAASWDEQDRYFAAFFKWNVEPAIHYTEEELLQTLRDIDTAIVAFDEHIGHSDHGFRVWRSRHQTAMEKPQQEIPPWPKFLPNTGPGPIRWDDEVWARRYRHITTKRQLLAEKRLRDVTSMFPQEISKFFGVGFEPRREMWYKSRHRHYQNMGSEWWKPIDVLLEQAANDMKVDVKELQRTFWGPSFAWMYVKEEEG